MRALAVPTLLAVLALAAVPSSTVAQFGPGDGPLEVRLRITEGGEPLAASLWASESVEGTWRYAQDDLDEDGVVVLHLWPGLVNLQLRGPPPEDRNYGSAAIDLDGDVDLGLDVAGGAATVPFDLQVRDAETGDPLTKASVLLQMLFGGYLCIGERPVTMTAPPISGQPTSPPPPGEPCDLQWTGPGHLRGHVPPGVVVVQVATNDPVCLVHYGDPDSDCKMYAPATRLLQATEGEDTEAEVGLVPVPPPDAFVEGYLLTNVTGEPLPRKHVTFRGTGAFDSVYFGADMDPDGSYRLGIPSGDYTVSAQLCGHDDLSVPFRVLPGETLRLDLTLQPAGYLQETWTETVTNGMTVGRSFSGGDYSAYTYPRCDATPTPTTVGGPADPETPDPEPAREEEPEPVGVSLVGGLAIANFYGGLGPFGGRSEETLDDGPGEDALEEHDGGRFTAGLSMLAVVALVAGLAARRRLR